MLTLGHFLEYQIVGLAGQEAWCRWYPGKRMGWILWLNRTGEEPARHASDPHGWMRPDGMREAPLARLTRWLRSARYLADLTGYGALGTASPREWE